MGGLIIFLAGTKSVSILMGGISMKGNPLDNLEENITMEVLVSTVNGDGTYNIRPFGARYDGHNFILRMFPNQSLINIKNTGKLIIYFTQDILLFTRALLARVSQDELLGNVECSFMCRVAGMESTITDDIYGNNSTTKIIAEPIKIMEHNNKLPLINRATNQILELLIDFSRYHLMDVDARNNFNEKLIQTEKIIIKTGNDKHKKAMKTIKKRIE